MEVSTKEKFTIIKGMEMANWPSRKEFTKENLVAKIFMALERFTINKVLRFTRDNGEEENNMIYDLV